MAQVLSCSNCKEEKDESLFPKATGKSRGYAWVCKSCKKTKREEKRSQMPHEDWLLQNRKYWLKTKYNLTLEEYNDKLLEQKHQCAICFADEINVFKGLLFVDHCHTTGKVRGLLCHHCNTALGKFKDSEQILNNAINYLEQHK
jgi:hypothetical protein